MITTGATKKEAVEGVPNKSFSDYFLHWEKRRIKSIRSLSWVFLGKFASSWLSIAANCPQKLLPEMCLNLWEMRNNVQYTRNWYCTNMNVQIYADWNRFLFESLPQKMKKVANIRFTFLPGKDGWRKRGGGGGGRGRIRCVFTYRHIDI